MDQTMILEHLNLFLLIRGTLYSGFQFITFLGVGYNYEGIREKKCNNMRYMEGGRVGKKLVREGIGMERTRPYSLLVTSLASHALAEGIYQYVGKHISPSSLDMHAQPILL